MKWLFVAVLVFMAASAEAGQSTGVTCAEYVAELDRALSEDPQGTSSVPVALLAGLVEGYYLGANLALPGSRQLSRDSILTPLRKRCAQHPDELAYDAVWRVANDVIRPQ